MLTGVVQWRTGARCGVRAGLGMARKPLLCLILIASNALLVSLCLCLRMCLCLYLNLWLWRCLCV